MALSPSAVAAIITVLGLVATGAARYGYNQIRDDLGELEDEKADAELEERMDNLEAAHVETRRLAETAYASVHGDDDRPEDSGFIVDTRERWERLESDVEGLSMTVSRLEEQQKRHQERTEAVLEAVADDLDIELVYRDGDSD